jgi:hypothetical protein
VRDGLAKLGAQVNFSASESFAAFVRTELAKWVRLAGDANIRIDLQ